MTNHDLNALANFKKVTPDKKSAVRRKARSSINELSSDPTATSAHCACGGVCPSCTGDSSGLRVSQPNDAAEIQADRMADEAMQNSSSNIQPAMGDETSAGSSEARAIHRKHASTKESVPASKQAPVDGAINSGGQPLDQQTRDFFEPRFNHDFSNVRVHTDSIAHHSAKAIHAKAYTLGNNIVFGSGEYNPESENGKHLLAHELAHVTQSESLSNIRRDTIYRQPDQAQILAEIQMLRVQLMMPVNPLRPMLEMRLIQLEAMLNQTGGKPIAPSKAKVVPTKPQANTTTGNADDDFYASLDNMTQLELDEMNRQLQDFRDRAAGRFGNQQWQPSQPTQAPQPTQAGCHTDPYVKTNTANICGGGHHKKIDEATLASQKALQMPPPDFSEYEAKERAMLDRLNSAHLAWKQTGNFVQSTEFSPYEIQKDRIIPLWKRWDLFEKSDPEKDSVKNPVEYYFRAGGEYIQEKERRITQRPFKNRLYHARSIAQQQSNHWYSANEANERMTGDEIWSTGVSHDLFIESEKARVYKEQGELQEIERIEREERQRQDRRNWKAQQYNAHVARGKQLNSPTNVLQPFAMAAFGAPVAAVYGGMQLGIMGNEAYHSCKDGFSFDRAAAAAPIVVTAVTHQLTKPGTGGRPSTTSSNTAPIKPNVVEPAVKPTVVEPVTKPVPTPPVIEPSIAPTVGKTASPPTKTAVDPVVPPVANTAVDPVAPPVAKTATPLPNSTAVKITSSPQNPIDLKKIDIDVETPQILDAANFSKVQLKPGQDALYIVRDGQGAILKTGKTSEGAAVGRFNVYKNAGASQIEVYPLKPSKKTPETYEKSLRSKLESEGHAMPWDNSPDKTGKPRLGRPGFGTPGEGVRTPLVSKEVLIDLLKQHKGNRNEVAKAIATLLGRKSLHQRTVGMWAQAYGIDTKQFK